MPDPAPTDQVNRSKELLDSLWNDSTLGAQIRQKAKEKYPDIVLPEDTIAPALAPLQATLAATQKQLEEMQARETARLEAEAKAKEERQAFDYEASINKVRSERNLSDEGFQKMLDRMKSTGNYTDPEAAAAWVMEQSPPPKPAGPYLGPQAPNFYGTQVADERYRLLHQSPGDGFVDAELREFIADPDAYVRSAGL